MYHYIPASGQEDLYGSLLRDPQSIRDEICLIRELLTKAQARMEAAEKAKEDLTLALLSDDHPNGEQVRRLEDVIESCEEAKAAIEELWQRADTLSEELSETLWWLRGATA